MPKYREYPKIQFTGNRYYSFQYYLHKALRLPLWQLVVIMVFIFFVINGVFAFFYSISQGLVLGNSMEDPSLWDILFFCYTFPVVGYGGIVPVGAGKFIAVVQIFIGMLLLASMTGVMFNKFSQTPSPFIWSKQLVFNSMNGKEFLQVRINNIVGNDVINVHPELFFQKMVKNDSGSWERTLVPLKVQQSKIPIFAFSWVVSHLIDSDSPVFKWIHGEEDANTRIVGFIHGFDSVLGKDVYSYARWSKEELVNGHFEEVLVEYKEDEKLRPVVRLDFTKIDSVINS